MGVARPEGVACSHSTDRDSVLIVFLPGLFNFIFPNSLQTESDVFRTVNQTCFEVVVLFVCFSCTEN